MCVCVCARARRRAAGSAKQLGTRPLLSVVSTKQAEHGCVVSTSVRIHTEHKGLFLEDTNSK